MRNIPTFVVDTLMHKMSTSSAKKVRAEVLRQYERICGLAYFDDRSEKFLPAATPHQEIIVEFLDDLSKHINGSTGIAEGFRYHFITTNYDYVIERLLDSVLAPDDTCFIYTYRGFTPDRFANRSNLVPVHNHWLVQHLIKLNGGFEIIRSSGNGYELYYSNRQKEEIEKEAAHLNVAITGAINRRVSEIGR